MRPPITFFEQDMEQCELHDTACGQVAIYSNRAPGKETVNEDSAAIVEVESGCAVLAVADGAGGMSAGAQASRLTIEHLASALDIGRPMESGLREAVLSGIENASSEVLALGIGAASTVAVMEILGDRIRPYHVGDSMILVMGQRGKMKLQTVSHSPVGYAVESGMLDEQEAMHHDERHLVSNMVGDPDMHIQLGSELQLAPRDTVVIASDGLFDNLYVDEIVAIARSGPLRRAANRLAQACHYRMQHPQEGHPSKPDDLTFILFRRGVKPRSKN
jgi:serine/threonine protein phosphatase PrpC